MQVTLQNLIDRLNAALESGVDPDTEVRVVYQPNYPIVALLDGVATESAIQLSELRDAKEEHKVDEDVDEDTRSSVLDGKDEIVYLVAGYSPQRSGDSPYGSKRAWDVCDEDFPSFEYEDASEAAETLSLTPEERKATPEERKARQIARLREMLTKLEAEMEKARKQERRDKIRRSYTLMLFSDIPAENKEIALKQLIAEGMTPAEAETFLYCN